MRSRPAIPLRIVTALSMLVVVLAWAVATTSGWIDDLFMPTPSELWSSAWDLVDEGYKSRPLLDHIGLSLLRVFAGFGTGAVAGTLLGLAMGVRPRLNALAAPFIEFLRPLPQLAYLVLLIVWFGIGETPKIIMLFLAALPVCAVSARDGVRNVSQIRVNVARALGASEWQIFRHVIFPSALPEILTGARLALGIVYGTLIAAEIVAGSTGLGWMIMDAGRFLRSDYVFVGILIIGFMGIGLDRALVLIERRVVHWAGR
jgi:taurine transport system permease protein